MQPDEGGSEAENVTISFRRQMPREKHAEVIAQLMQLSMGDDVERLVDRQMLMGIWITLLDIRDRLPMPPADQP